MNLRFLSPAGAEAPPHAAGLPGDWRDWLRPARWRRLPVPVVLLLLSLYWLASANRSFMAAALAGRELADAATWVLVGALGTAVVALHFGLLSLLALAVGRHLLKPLLIVLLVITALAAHYMQQYGVYLDATMLRNVLHTQPREARELITLGMLLQLLLFAGLPAVLLGLWQPRHRRWRLRLLHGLGGAALALLVVVLAALLVFQPLASLMRNHKEVRYLVTPANVLWSTGRVLASDTRAVVVARRPIGLDAAPGPRMLARTRPQLVVMVVGETARAANWGLSGYSRQTTPELAGLPVINFAQVEACGTNTETSLPCMFAPVGRRNYDEATIRGQQSLLHVLARAGVAVEWRDNQTGCKGVCEGLPEHSVRELNPPGLCQGENCFDLGLLAGFEQRLATAQGSQLLVLHQLGNHGPAYYRRHPPQFARFQPACTNDDLERCSLAEIVNAYDNALLYTDHVLATLIRQLQAHAGRVDSAVVYVSDHGESLGENRLFLHGVPYAIAPEVQTRVPMLMWLSDGFRAAGAIDAGCLAQRAKASASHDHLFHTLLGLIDVRTSLYEPAWDLVAGCRAQAAPASVAGPASATTSAGAATGPASAPTMPGTARLP